MKATSRTFRCAIAAGMGMIGMVAPVSISLTEIMPGLVGRMNTTAGCRSAISMTIPKRYDSISKYDRQYIERHISEFDDDIDVDSLSAAWRTYIDESRGS